MERLKTVQPLEAAANLHTSVQGSTPSAGSARLRTRRRTLPCTDRWRRHWHRTQWPQQTSHGKTHRTIKSTRTCLNTAHAKDKRGAASRSPRVILTSAARNPNTLIPASTVRTQNYPGMLAQAPNRSGGLGRTGLCQSTPAQACKASRMAACSPRPFTPRPVNALRVCRRGMHLPSQRAARSMGLRPDCSRARCTDAAGACPCSARPHCAA